MQVQFNVLFYLYWNVNFILAVRYNIWDLSSQTRDQTCVSCIGGIVPWPLDCQGSPKMWMICTDYTHLRDYFITFKYFIVLTFPLSLKNFTLIFCYLVPERRILINGYIRKDLFCKLPTSLPTNQLNHYDCQRLFMLVASLNQIKTWDLVQRLKVSSFLIEFVHITSDDLIKWSRKSGLEVQIFFFRNELVLNQGNLNNP